MSKTQKTESKSQRKIKKEPNKVLSYFRYAVVYLLAALVVIVPVSASVLSKAVNTVHKTQEIMTPGANEVFIDDSYVECPYSEFLDTVSVGKLLGSVSCESVGLCENVYYGLNRACLRNGAGLDATSYLFGEGGCSRVAAYPSTSFKMLKNIKIGEIITVQTYWGRYEYRVTQVLQGENAEAPNGDYLVLAVNSSVEPFSTQKGINTYVIAELTSMEVQ